MEGGCGQVRLDRHGKQFMNVEVVLPTNLNRQDGVGVCKIVVED